MKRLLHILVASLSIALLSLPAAADHLYRWVDEQGVTHFSESPPPSGTHDVEVRGSNPVRSEPSSSSKQLAVDRPFSVRSPGQDSLLWKIEGAAFEPSYILGTIHVADPRVLKLPRAVEKAFAVSPVFCMELIPDLQTVLGVTEAMLLTDGSNLATLLGEPWYGKAVEAMAARGMPEFAVARMKPWAVMTTLSTPATGGGPVLDTMLYQRAVDAGKNTVGLETAAQQLAVFESIPMRDQLALLRETLRHLDELPGLIDAMVEAYVDRDLAKIVKLAETTMSWGSPRLAENVQRDLIIRRNRRMVERMLPQVLKGGAFVAVGALHLPGETGIVSLLRERGMAVIPTD